MRNSYEVFNATSQLDLDLWAPDVECVQTAEVGSGETVFHGRDGVIQAVGELTETFEDFGVEPERFFDRATESSPSFGYAVEPGQAAWR